ncbi:MAG: GHKL domain-containing protein [Lachnospiraceae bacterium]|nr:GHKL domain-containing protein [Lachnospiraceae bacterium]
MEEFKTISYMMSHIFLMLFLFLFNTHRYRERTTAGICVLSFFLITLTDIVKLELFPDSWLCYVLITIVQILITQGTGILISAHRNSRVLFMGLSASNYVIAGATVATILYFYTEHTFLSLAGAFLVHSGILLILYFRIRDIWLAQTASTPAFSWQNRSEPRSTQNWWELCLIPTFFYCTFTFIAYFPNTLDKIPENIPGILFFLITMFVSYIVVLRYVEGEINKTDIYWKNVLFESYIKGLEDQYDLIQQSEQNLKILRHDIRHYSGMIHALLADKEYEKIRQIASHIHDAANANQVQRFCENLLLNTLLSKTAKRAETLAIDLQIGASVPKELPVNEYELTAVTANLLENALECVRNYEAEQRLVSLQIHCDDSHLLLHLQNPCKETISINPSTGLPKSQRGKNHGLGMQSIWAFSNKIRGTVGCRCEEGVFSITLFAKF